MRTWPAIAVERLREPDLLQAALLDHDVSAVEEQTPDAWTIYFPTAAARDRAATALTDGFPGLSLRRLDVPDEDWARRSQAGLRAVRVGAIIVAPPWDVPSPPAGAPIVLVIEPSMGFGTGHHATTRLCLDALQRLDLRGCRVVDVGTGSGVLAIAARALGAGSVVGLDDDADAVENAVGNAARNRVDVDLRHLDVRGAALPGADVVLANLTGGLLVECAPLLTALAAPRGTLVVSGVQAHEEATVLAAFPGLRAIGRTQEDEWVCLTLAHQTGDTGA